jgi:hypothetical protein
MICGGYVTVMIPRISNCSSQGTLCKILAAHEIKPHKVKYYLQNRDPEFAEKMAEVLEVYREVETLKVAARAQKGDAPAVAIISCDEKLGIQALATTAPDLPLELKVHETFARDQEYVRRRTMSLLAGLDLVTGVVHARVEERHRSREFADLLKQIDAAHAPAIAIKLLVDNHSSHKSKETGPGWESSRRDASHSPSCPNTAPGSISSKASSPSSPARCCATFASPTNRSSNGASWRRSIA